VPHFRVIASEVAFGVNFLAISLKTLRCAQQLTNLFMFLYQKGVSSQKCSHQITLSAVNWQVAPLHQPLSPTTSSVVPGVSSSSVIISPYVVSRASLLGRRTYLSARYSMDWREFTAQKVLKDTGCEATTVYAGKKPLVFPEDVLGIREVFGINGKAWLRKATISKTLCQDIVSRNPDWTVESLGQKIAELHRCGFIYKHSLQQDGKPWTTEQVWVLPSRCPFW
jgi:hypothetical protein